MLFSSSSFSSTQSSQSPLTATEDLVATESSGYFLGPMPIKHFLSKFLPRRTQARPVSGRVFEKVIPSSGTTKLTNSRKALINRFVRAATKVLPSMFVYGHADSPDPHCNVAVDIGIYGSRIASKSPTTFTLLDLFVDVYPDASADLFIDSLPLETNVDYPFERSAKTLLKEKVTLLSRVNAVSTLQPRVHTFSAAIYGRTARLFRWDAAGVVVSQAFDYVATEWLAEFFWRIDSMTSLERGRDCSVVTVQDPWPTTLAPPEVLEHLKTSNDHTARVSRHQHFSIMKIPDRDNPKVELDFLVSSPPRYQQQCPFGRKTQAMFAYDLTSERIVFVKQYWRAELHQEKEGDIYGILASKEVRHLPVFGKGNDVRDYSSLTQDVQNKSGRRWGRQAKGLIPYRMYRMSLETIGRPLHEFTSSRELVSAVRDAMICHDDAYFKANILHRDISPGNIMINVADGTGFLIDWDLCIDLNKPQPPPGSSSEPHRFGTWQFMSSRLLSRPGAPHTLIDDRESAIWSLTWVAFLYGHHDQVDSLNVWVEMFTERFPTLNGPPTGGLTKMGFITNWRLEREVTFDPSPGLGAAIASLVRWIRCRYCYADSNTQLVRMLRKTRASTPEEERQMGREVARLGDEGVFVQAINSALDQRELWSEVDDPAVPHRKANGDPLSVKRSASVAGLDSDDQRKPKLRRTGQGTPQPRARRKLAMPPSDRVLRPLPRRVAA